MSLNNASGFIGAFDSGAGGLSILQAIHQQLPREHTLYIADSAHAPYGNQPESFIIDRSLYLCESLIKMGAKSIVVACNTATVHSINTLRAQFNLPIIGIEPGIKPAVLHSPLGKIGIMATTRTTQSASFNNLLKNFTHSRARAYVQPCPGLVECIENPETDVNSTKTLLIQLMQPLFNEGIDTLVLGCTHYVFLSDLIDQVIQEHSRNPIYIIHTQEAVAKETQRRLTQEQLLNTQTQTRVEHYYTTGDEVKSSQLFSKLMNKTISVKALPY